MLFRLTPRPAGRAAGLRRATITWLACILASLLTAAPVSAAKGPSVRLVTKTGTAQAGAAADALFTVAKGSKCHLLGRHVRSRVRGRTVRAFKPMLQYHWTVPKRARTGTWRLTLICTKAHRV